jgi:hypothetical protein
MSKNRLSGNSGWKAGQSRKNECDEFHNKERSMLQEARKRSVVLFKKRETKSCEVVTG